jgi:N-acetylglucosamine malate deacetylase 1
MKYLLHIITILTLLCTYLFEEGYAEMNQREQKRTILAVGAHPVDMEITAGAVLAKHAKMGDRVVILHLTLGEKGNPNLSPDEYAEQKVRESKAAAGILGAEVIFGPYKDAEIPNDEEARLYVNEVIRRVQPTYVITHWKNSFHKDHINTHAIVNDAVLLAGLEGIESEHPPHRDVRGIYYTENWEDMEEYDPYIFVDVTETFSIWKEAVLQHQLVAGGISTFPYFDYYESLARVRGALIRVPYAVTFNIGYIEKRQTLDYLQDTHIEY